jgi:hypothetical protein
LERGQDRGTLILLERLQLLLGDHHGTRVGQRRLIYRRHQAIHSLRPSEVADTMTVNIDANRSACLRYISGSTKFLDSRHGIARSLPDGVLGSGVAVGPLGLVLSNGTRYVVFSVRAVGLASGSRCS